VCVCVYREEKFLLYVLNSHVMEFVWSYARIMDFSVDGFFMTDLEMLCSNCKRRVAARSCHYDSSCEMMSRIKSTIAYKYWMRASACVLACVGTRVKRRQSRFIFRMLSVRRKRAYMRKSQGDTDAIDSY